MAFLQHTLKNLPEYRRLVTLIKEGVTPSAVFGLSNVHKAHLAASLCKQLNQKGVIITPDEASAQRLLEDLDTFLGEGKAILFPARDYVFLEVEGVSREYEHKRLAVLGQVIKGECEVAVCSAEALLQYTMPRDLYCERTLSIQVGQRLQMQEITQRLVAMGYVSRPQVDGICQFSRRGGILDIFPPSYPNPVRLEFFDDEIDSLAAFDMETQRRIDSLKACTIPPGAEVLIPDTGTMVQRLSQLLQSYKKKDPARDERINADIELLQAGVAPQGLDRYLPLCYQTPQTLLDYFDAPLVFVSDYTAVKEAARAFSARMVEDIKILVEDGMPCFDTRAYAMDYPDLVRTLEQNGALLLDTFTKTVPDILVRSVVNIEAVSRALWGGEFKLLCEDINDLLLVGFGVAVLCGTEKGAQTLAKDLSDAGIPAVFSTDIPDIDPGRVAVSAGALSGGVEYPSIKRAVLCHGGRTVRSRKKAKKKANSSRTGIRLSELYKGDYVVHVSHGIGIFQGIEKKEVQGVVKDYIKIQYAGADTLFVPVTQLDLVSKYIGPKDDSRVKLNKLNSVEWQKTKQRVRQAVDDMAQELTLLYAKRMQTKGYAFSEDNDWQRDFEERFPYEETDDQLRCVEEIKGDMQRPVPMDRLLCGDVGFGKTEVALRAAFKAVLDSKQVAILVPTTILAWQHYQTILQRMEGFPIEIELMSRFRSPKQQKETIKRLQTGEVDIVVGTHRLVQEDVKFKDLGLVIIDEEQRFGVRHKERFKELRNNVDVLTLSATPIPRTLNMAMSGIRDMSVIEEAPLDRYPVQTYVLEYNEAVIYDAIRKELRRGGQVFYLYNRVETIDKKLGELQNAFPDARIVSAHGKLPEEQLSKIWQQLLEREIDILVCTTIIETGVDVQNCNTLIIEDADRMGLSQLYQLRGRVGRSNRRAFAYMTFRRGKVLTEVAAKRLSAIREFTKFGSGFQIALRDLEIRGAGSILGAKQHGHMEAVGYELYVKLLSEAVAQQRGEKPADALCECLVDIRLDAHIPESYIPDLSQRLDVYKKVASVKNEDDVFDVTDELIDRFGDVPQAVKGLIDVALLRNRAAQRGFVEITQRADTLYFYMKELDMQLASKIAGAFKRRAMVSPGKKPYIAVKMQEGTPALDTMREVLSVE